MHCKFRNYEQKAVEVIKRLGLGPDSVVMDMGCGTGAFALHIAKKCRMVYAVDISATMIDFCQDKAEKQGITNIVYCRAGMLTYEHAGDPVDAIICVAVLHHLPGFWKQIALNRFYSILRPGGKFFFYDIVFPSNDANDEVRFYSRIDSWIQTLEERGSPRLAREGEIHVKEEFSTYDWIMEGMITRSGLVIETAENGPAFWKLYICGRP